MFEEHIPSIAAFNALFNQLMEVLSEVYTPTEPLLLSEDLSVQPLPTTGRRRTAPSKR